MTRLVLASASSGRLRVLRQAGVDPLVIVSGVDEDAVVAGLAPDSAPAAVVTALAEAKAQAVLTSVPAAVAGDCAVVGCDSMLLLDGGLRGKPGDRPTAERAWAELSGRSAELLTGHCLIRLVDGSVRSRSSAPTSTVVRFGTPSEPDLAAYLDSGEPLGVAGGFTLDGWGGWFVSGVVGDPSAVIGIGLPTLGGLLAQAGVGVGDLWRANPVPGAGADPGT